jgi:hypothetical protein
MGITARTTTDDAAPARQQKGEQNRTPNSSRKEPLDAWAGLARLRYSSPVDCLRKITGQNRRTGLLLLWSIDLMKVGSFFSQTQKKVRGMFSR